MIKLTAKISFFLEEITKVKGKNIICRVCCKHPVWFTVHSGAALICCNECSWRCQHFGVLLMSG